MARENLDSRRSSPRHGPSVVQMMGLVATVVASVILVFFAIGYLLGRLLL